METRISQTQLDEICESSTFDADDNAWWVYGRVSNALETLIDIINGNLSDSHRLVLVPAEKYVKCTCEFVKKYNSKDNRDVFEHIIYCNKHNDEKPRTLEDHINDCNECQMEYKN